VEAWKEVGKKKKSRAKDRVQCRNMHCKKVPVPNSFYPGICFPNEAWSFPGYSLSQPGIFTESF
jgi:hypothetical protein